MRIIKMLVFLGFLCGVFFNAAFASEVSQTFKGGIWGLKWGASIEEVKEKFPEGRLSSPAGIQQYAVFDGRDVFGVYREEDNEIQFFFDANSALNGISLEFPYKSISDYGSLLNKLITLFGKTEKSTAIQSAVNASWPEDEGVVLSLTYISGMFMGGKLLVGVGYSSPSKPSITKAKLGLE